MRKTALVMICIVVGALAGCGNFEWLPNSTNSGSTVLPKPSNDIANDVQADTIIDSTYFKTLPYQVKFNNLTTHALSASISIGGDSTSQYSIDGGSSWKGINDSQGTVSGGTNVYVRHTSSNLVSNKTIVSTLYLGGYSAIYTSTIGSLIFPTKSVTAGSITKVQSDTAYVPATPPYGFTYGSPTTIKLNTNSSNDEMYINGNLANSVNNLVAGDYIYFKHTPGSTSGAVVTTSATLTGSNNTTYTVTFKSKAL